MLACRRTQQQHSAAQVLRRSQSQTSWLQNTHRSRLFSSRLSQTQPQSSNISSHTRPSLQHDRISSLGTQFTALTSIRLASTDSGSSGSTEGVGGWGSKLWQKAWGPRNKPEDLVKIESTVEPKQPPVHTEELLADSALQPPIATDTLLVDPSPACSLSAETLPAEILQMEKAVTSIKGPKEAVTWEDVVLALKPTERHWKQTPELQPFRDAAIERLKNGEFEPDEDVKITFVEKWTWMTEEKYNRVLEKLDETGILEQARLAKEADLIAAWQAAQASLRAYSAERVPEHLDSIHGKAWQIKDKLGNMIAGNPISPEEKARILSDPYAFDQLRALGIDNGINTFKGYVQFAFESIHSFTMTDLSWGTVIIINAMLFRTLVFSINAFVSNNTVKLKEWEQHTAPLVEKRTEAKKAGDRTTAKSLTTQLNAYYRKAGAHPYINFMAFAPLPISVAIFQFIRQMAILPVPQLQNDPLLPWCPDLTSYDPYFVLPITLSYIAWSWIKGATKPGGTAGMEENPVTNLLIPFFKKLQGRKSQIGINVSVTPLICGVSMLVPHAMFLHICVATVAAGAMPVMIKKPLVREYLRLKPLPTTASLANVKNLNLGLEARPMQQAIVSGVLDAKRRKGLGGMGESFSNAYERFSGSVVANAKRQINDKQKSKQELATHGKYEAQIKVLEKERTEMRRAEVAMKTHYREQPVGALPKKKMKDKKNGKK